MLKPTLSPGLRLVLTLLTVLALIAFVYLYTSQEQNPPSSPGPSSPRPPTSISSGPTVTPEKPLFDFYLLSLSWSPDYCAESGGRDTQQCSIGRRLGFVLHGLWPQYQRGYPSYCPSKTLLSNAVKDKFPGLFPNASLYDHEWQKHGTCTGLNPEAYLALSKQIKDSVVIPAAYRTPEQPFRTTIQKLKQEFVTANPGLTDTRLAVFCSDSGRFLSELRLCFSSDGQPTGCSTEVLRDSTRSCPNPDFQVRNVR